MTNNQQPPTRDEASKVRAEKVNAIAKFVADNSDVSINVLLNHLVTFGRMYDIDALLRYYDWAHENDESDADILETIMHDLSGIKEDPNTFSPRSSSYWGGGTMTIIYTQGDILEDASQAIVIPVNTVGVPGAGLAKAWALKDPVSAKLYKALCKLERIKIGEVATITNEDRLWVLFPTKEHWENPSKLEWIEDGLIHLCQVIKDLQLKSIAIPALGCGLGGLDWEDVKPLIQAYLLQIRIPITIYLPQ